MGDAERDFSAGLPVALLGLDGAERGLLAVLRHLMTADHAPQTEAWETALILSTERWGASDGVKILLAAKDFLRSLRQARPGHFRHADPLDLEAREHLFPEEASLMRMLCAMRRDVTPEARAQMAKLTGGRIDPTLVQRGLTLVRLLPAPMSGGVMCRPGPALRLIH